MQHILAIHPLVLRCIAVSFHVDTVSSNREMADVGPLIAAAYAVGVV